MEPEPFVLDPSKRPASALAFSPDGQRLVTGGVEGRLRVFSVPSGEAVAEWDGHDKSVNVLSFFPDGRRVVSSGSDARVHVRDAKTGTLLANAAADGKVRLWPVDGIVG